MSVNIGRNHKFDVQHSKYWPILVRTLTDIFVLSEVCTLSQTFSSINVENCFVMYLNNLASLFSCAKDIISHILFLQNLSLHFFFFQIVCSFPTFMTENGRFYTSIPLIWSLSFNPHKQNQNKNMVIDAAKLLKYHISKRQIYIFLSFFFYIFIQ